MYTKAGQERFKAVALPFSLGSHACMVVLDLNDKKTTIESLEKMLNEFQKHAEINDARTRMSLI